MASSASNDPFPVAKRHIQEQVNKLQQDYSRWSTMMLSNPGKLGLGDRLQTTCNTVLRTLKTMDKSVDKAESDPQRFGVAPAELADRRQWIQDTQAHVRQVLSALENVETGFPAVSIPGNAGLHSEVGTSQEQQQIALEQQDVALDRIEKAAQRVGALGLEIHREIGDQERLLEQVERDTDGVMSRVSASMHKMHDVIKKMNSCTQMGIIAALIAVLIVLIFFLGN